uniref:Uncharacterized protein n=1 Tax=Arundo donax TaxID=35708 RepID=A0A0A9AWG8_ARUDO
MLILWKSVRILHIPCRP